MKKTKTNIEKLLTHFAKGKTVTEKQAVSQLKINRLSARIYDLRNKFGLDIDLVKTKTGSKYQLAESNLSQVRRLSSSF